MTQCKDNQQSNYNTIRTQQTYMTPEPPQHPINHNSMHWARSHKTCTSCLVIGSTALGTPRIHKHDGSNFKRFFLICIYVKQMPTPAGAKQRPETQTQQSYADKSTTTETAAKLNARLMLTKQHERTPGTLSSIANIMQVVQTKASIQTQNMDGRPTGKNTGEIGKQPEQPFFLIKWRARSLK